MRGREREELKHEVGVLHLIPGCQVEADQGVGTGPDRPRYKPQWKRRTVRLTTGTQRYLLHLWLFQHRNIVLCLSCFSVVC